MFPTVILIFAVIAYRLAFAFSGIQADWANFSPLAAITFCSAVFFTRKIALFIPIIAILVSDLILNAHYQVALFDTGMLSRYFSFWIILMLGFWVRKQQQCKLLYLLLSTVVGSLIFYVVTNTDAWLMQPEYKKNLAGWVQALTIGLPNGYPPTLLYFRNTIVSDLLFTGLFVATQTAFTKPTVMQLGKVRHSH